MITINSLQLINYGSHANSFIELKSNITSILAEFSENKDRSNGGGKSTILDAIRFALFGKGKFSKQEEVLRRYEGKIAGDAEVNLILSNGLNITRKILNQKNGAKGELSIEFNGQIFQQSEAQNEIEKILDENYNLFTASYFFPEGETDLFTNTTPAFRRDYINSIFEEKLKIYKDVINATNNEFKTFTEKKKQIENSLEIYQKDLQASEKQLLEIQLLSLEEVQSFEKSIIDISQQINDKEKELKELETPELLVKQKELKAIIENSNNEIKKLIEETKVANNTISIQEKEIADFKFVRGIEDKINNLKQNLEKTKESFTHYLIKKSPIHQKIETLEKLENICPTCGQSISEVYKRDILEELYRELEEIEFSLSSLSQAQQSESLDLQQILELETKQNRQLKLKEQFETTKKNLESIIEKNNRLVQQLYEKIGLIKIEYSEIERKIDKATMTDLLKTELQLMKESYTRIKKILDIQKQEEGRKTQKEEDIAHLKIKIANESTALFDIQKELTVTDISLSVAKESLNFASKYYLQSIEDESNSILSKINSEYSFSIEEKDNANKDIELYLTVRGNPTSYKRLSLGEKRMVDVACRLAISSVLNMGKRSKIGFVCIDEIFSNLDVYNQKQLLIIFNEIKTKFEQIIILDHSPYLKDVFQSITVSMENGVSKILLKK